MSETPTYDDLLFLVENINSPYDQLLMLRSTIELSLLKIGHNQDDVAEALEQFYKRGRTLH